jgi:predicted  nucleic acid-binding Zn-ribbon protein
MDESWRLSRDEALRQRDEARLWVERLQEEVRLSEAQVRELEEKNKRLRVLLDDEIKLTRKLRAALVPANEETDGA